MADFEVLAPGGHQHLVDKIEERLDLKADASILEEVNEINRNQTKSTITGELLVASDSYAEPPLSLTVEGKSTQASTTGKNLFDASTAESGKYVNNAGTISNAGGWYASDYIAVVAGLTYTLSGSTATSGAAQHAFYDSTKSFLSSVAAGVNDTFVVPEGAAFVRLSIKNTTLDATQLEVGSTATAYEPYTGGKPSPSPNYMQEIVSVDELAVAFAGKNLLDAANHAVSALATYTYENDTLTITAALASGWCYLRYRVSAVEWAQGQSVTLSTIASATSTPFFGIEFYDADGSRISYATSSSAAITRAVPNDTSYILVLFYARNTNAGAVGDTATYRNIQLELGSTPTAYEPYAGHTVTVPLQDHVLRSLPDGTKDTLSLTYLRPSTREGWAWYSRELVQRVGAYDGATLASNTHWALDANGFFYVWNWYVSPALKNQTNQHIGDVYCNILDAASYSEWLQSDWQCSQLSALRMNVDTSVTGNTVESFKAWLAESGLIYCGVLATPVTHDLGEVELPVLPAPTCTIWADPTTGLQMEYVRDTNLTIQQINADIDGAYEATEKAYASIATIESSTAAYNHAVGSYLMLGGTLYKVTSAIATGEAIVPGTNVTATTVMAELAALL